ncbi:unnamed protein product [Fraxinus pennsylvanica]|uniref:Uncharacterized protein n=1 Tax=Fraxinus pennsylvanica TaxID=56036 RepID=A0AAD1YUH6_9LAMI|nr:unnamed protein product [Fraxinus pennsylvanica]
MDLLQSSIDPDMDKEEDEVEPKSELQPETSDQDPSPDSSPIWISFPSKSAAPRVNDTMLSFTVAGKVQSEAQKPLNPTEYVVSFNPTYDQLGPPSLARPILTPRMGLCKASEIISLDLLRMLLLSHLCLMNNIILFINLDMKQNDGVSVYNILQHEQKKRKLEEKKEMLEEIENERNDLMDLAEVYYPAAEAEVDLTKGYKIC